eukprot:4263897-Amphidinium_carterae.1
MVAMPMLVCWAHYPEQALRSIILCSIERRHYQPYWSSVGQALKRWRPAHRQLRMIQAKSPMEGHK